MKKYILLIIASSLFFLSSCEKMDNRTYGFNSEINKNSTAYQVFHVHRYIDNIYLYGSVKLTQGAVVVQLIDPEGEIVHYDEITAHETISVNKYYNSKSGYWRFSYKSYDAQGEIDLHLSF